MLPLVIPLLKGWVIAVIKGGFVPVLSQALESDFDWQVTSRKLWYRREYQQSNSQENAGKERIFKGILKRQN